MAVVVIVIMGNLSYDKVENNSLIFSKKDKEELSMKWKLILNGVAIMLCVCLFTAPIQAGVTVHYSFNEVTSGTWDVFVKITDSAAQTAGLSSYALWVYTDPATVNYTENTLFDAGTYKGFFPGNLLQGNVDGDFNVGNYQNHGAYALTGIGIDPISQGAVNLGVPARLGTLSTPAGLGESHFAVSGAGLLNADNDGYLPETEMSVSYEVNPIPEPSIMGIAALGMFGILRRRQQRHDDRSMAGGIKKV